MDTVLRWPYGQHTQLVAQEPWKQASRARLASQHALYKTRVLLEEQELRHVMPQAHVWMRALTA
jgi:hypothetical protein